MAETIPYETIAAVIAQHIHRHWYREEKRINLPPIMVFDNRCSSTLQVPAAVLTKLKIMEPIDSMSRRSVFLCEPEKFEAVAKKNRNSGCRYDVLVLAMIDLTSYVGDNRELLFYLVALGVCEPVEEPFHEAKVWQIANAISSQPRDAVPPLFDFEYRWTSEYERYEEFSRDRVSPIQ